jgi:hypothetical protein
VLPGRERVGQAEPHQRHDPQHRPGGRLVGERLPLLDRVDQQDRPGHHRQATNEPTGPVPQPPGNPGGSRHEGGGERELQDQGKHDGASSQT